MIRADRAAPIASTIMTTTMTMVRAFMVILPVFPSGLVFPSGG
jgi:hypothetical protein